MIKTLDRKGDKRDPIVRFNLEVLCLVKISHRHPLTYHSQPGSFSVTVSICGTTTIIQSHIHAVLHILNGCQQPYTSLTSADLPLLRVRVLCFLYKSLRLQKRLPGYRIATLQLIDLACIMNAYSRDPERHSSNHRFIYTSFCSLLDIHPLVRLSWLLPLAISRPETLLSSHRLCT